MAESDAHTIVTSPPAMPNRVEGAQRDAAASVGQAADRCLACAGEIQHRAVVLPAGSYSSCPSCGLESLDPLPTELDTARLFDRGYFTGEIPGGYADYDADRALHEANAKARFALIRRYLGEAPASVLDVGCANGHFLAAAREQGASVHGVDLSPWARAEAARAYQLDVAASLPELVTGQPGAFAAVTFFQSLEHMPRPDEALAAARACIHPRGILVIETWDSESAIARLQGKSWQQRNPPTVIHVMSRRSLVRLLDRCGFERVEIERTAKLVSVGLVLHILADKLVWLRGPIEWLKRVRWLARLRLRYRMGDLITLVARPRAGG